MKLINYSLTVRQEPTIIFGGSGHLVVVLLKQLQLTFMAMSARMANVSTVVTMEFAPLCGYNLIDLIQLTITLKDSAQSGSFLLLNYSCSYEKIYRKEPNMKYSCIFNLSNIQLGLHEHHSQSYKP